MTRGGKRQGAGRPVGTKKEPTIAYQRKIKPEWVKLMDAFLKELKEKAKQKSILIVFLMLLLALPCSAFQYTIETARDEALKNIPKFCILPNKEAVQRTYYIRNLDTNNILSMQQINKNFVNVVYFLINPDFEPHYTMQDIAHYFGKLTKWTDKIRSICQYSLPSRSL